MEIEKIEIKTKNTKHHTDVALLVDKPGFLNWVERLRKKWKIEKPYKSSYIKFLTHLCGEQKDSNRELLFRKDIEKVRKVFSRTPNFDEVIFYAVAFNEVPEGAYRTCYLKTIVNPTDPDDFESYEYAITVTPHTTPKELTEELKRFKKEIKRNMEIAKDKKKIDEAVAKYNFGYLFGPKYPDFDNITTIERVRAWYWARFEDVINGKTKKPRTYSEAWKIVESQCPKSGSHHTDKEHKECPFCGLDDLNVMHQLLPNYIKRLKSQSTLV